MSISGKFLFLGTGGSMGVPVIGCDCSICTSTSPFNKRLRTAGLIQIQDKTILIDCGPDFRNQMLRSHIKTIDGLIFTHAHYDHAAGFDEIRIVNIRNKKPVPCLLSEATAKDLQQCFSYIFDKNDSKIAITTKISPTLLNTPRGQVEFLGLPFQYMTYEQGGMLVNGYRIGNFAYITDIRNFPETIFEDLEGVEILVVSCLREEPSPLHFNVNEAVEFSKRVGAKKAWFTHIAHELDHETINAKLPQNYRLAYDGLSLDFTIP